MEAADVSKGEFLENDGNLNCVSMAQTMEIIDGVAQDTSPADSPESNASEPSANEIDEATVVDRTQLNNDVLHQIEFYFCDANILKDQFMLNQVKSSKEGWVKLSVIENFRKVRKLTNDHDIILQAISLSDKLELSTDGASVRRCEPLPKWDYLVYYRTVILSDFPENADISLYGIVEPMTLENRPPLLVRILPPLKKVPFDLKRSQAQHSCIGTKLCAVVELAEESLVPKAISAALERWPHVYAHPLSEGRKKNNASKKTKKRLNEGGTGATAISPPSSTESRPMLNLRSALNVPRMTHIREPIGPTTEDNNGFPPGWRDLMRLQRMCLVGSGAGSATAAAPSCSAAELMPLDSAILSVRMSPGALPLSAG